MSRARRILGEALRCSEQMTVYPTFLKMTRLTTQLRRERTSAEGFGVIAGVLKDSPEGEEANIRYTTDDRRPRWEGCMHGRTNIRKGVRLLLIGVLMFLLADQSHAQAADATQRKDPLTVFFCQLTIDGLEGNRPELRPGAMVFQTYSVETVRPSGSTSGPMMFVLTVKLSIPQVSPLFMLANATGVHFGQAAMQCMTQTNAIALQWTLWDVTISSYKSGLDAAPGLPMDEVSLSASKVEFNNVTPPIKFSWDAKVNQGGVVTPTGAVQYLPPPVPARPPLPGVQNAPPPVPLR